MDGDKTVTANFSQDGYTLTINIEGSGSVAKDPDQGTYVYGTSVELTAIADPGWTFSHWDDDLTGSTNPDSIVMDGDKTVTANFSQLPVHTINLDPKWNLVSIPVYENIGKTDITVRYDNNNYSWTEAAGLGILLNDIYDWDRVNQVYIGISTLEPGKSYWMQANFDCELIIYSDAVGTGDITLLPVNWSLVGLPYEEIVNKQNLIIHCDGHDITWADAINSTNPTGNPIIIPFIYGWDRVNQYYMFSDTLEADYGYWIFAYQECTLKK